MKTRKFLHISYPKIIMKIKNFWYTKYFEIVLLFIIAGIIIIAFLDAFSIIKLPELTNKMDLLYSLLSAQASISTIGIAVLALISGQVNRNIYGISVSDFVMYIKPFLKHRIIIVLNLLSILLTYIFISITFYYVSIALFISTILFSIKIVLDISQIFYGEENLKNKIAEYVIDNYNVDYLSKLNSEMKNAISANNSPVLFYDLKLLVEISIIELKNCDQNRTTENFKFLENALQESFLLAFKLNNKHLCIEILDRIFILYKEANKDEPIPLNIWDNIFHEYFKTISKIPIEELEGSNIIVDFHMQLYLNLNVGLWKETPFSINCKGLEYYTAQTYLNIIKNQNINQSEILIYKRVKESLYDLLIQLLDSSFSYQNDYKTFLAKIDLSGYLKVLIDNDENIILKKKVYQTYYVSNNSIIPIISSMIYLYYLSCREKLATKNQKEISFRILDENNYNFIDLLYDYSFSSFTEKDWEFLKKLMHNWEILPDNAAKYLEMDYVIEDFLIFSTLYINWDKNKIKSFLKILINNEPFPLYHRYFSQKNNNNNKRFIEYCKVILRREINDQRADSKIEIFKGALTEIYRESEIEKGIAHELSQEQLNEYSKTIKKQIELQSIKLLGRFFNKDNDGFSIKELHWPVLRFHTNLINETYFNKQLSELVQRETINSLFGIISGALKIKKVKPGEINKQDRFLASVKESGQIIDTIIGNMQSFWNEFKNESFNEMISNSQQIQYPGGDYELYAINHNLLYIRLTNINVILQDLTDDEINENSRIDEKGIYYNITNDIYIPFEKDILKTHVQRTEKKLIITGIIEYKIIGEVIGGGISTDYSE